MLAASFVLLPLASHTLIRFLPGEPFSGALFFVRAELCHQFRPAERSWAFTRCAGKDPPAQEHLGSANESHISSSQERNFIYCLLYVLPQLHFRSLRNTCNSCTSFRVENNIQIERVWVLNLPLVCKKPGDTEIPHSSEKNIYLLSFTLWVGTICCPECYCIAPISL